jgi:hypothetical protein
MSNSFVISVKSLLGQMGQFLSLVVALKNNSVVFYGRGGGLFGNRLFSL